jgi:undecaprenyl-diphosphatase
MQGQAGMLARLGSLDAALTAALTIPEDRRTPRLIALAVAHTGDSPVWAALLVFAWLAGGAAWRAPVILGAVGLVAAEIAVVVVKTVFKRPRPAGRDGRIYRRYDPYSLPSGHAARAAMLAILSGALSPLPVFIVIMAWAPVMLVSRIAIGIHYVLDVVAGIALGIGLTYALTAALGGVVRQL